MASPRDLTGVLRWWSADVSGQTIEAGRVSASPDVVAGSVAARFGQGRVGPEQVTVDGRPAWRFGGSASPASLLTPDVPAVTGAPYSWAVVIAPLANYPGQVIAPGPNSTVTSSSSQIVSETSGSFRWIGFAGANLFIPMPSGEHLVVFDHDGGSGVSRLYATGQTSSRGTLQRRSLAGQQHIGRHGSNDRPLFADVRALLLFDHALSDSEIATLEQWRAEGSSSQVAVRSGSGTVTVRSTSTGTGVPQRTGSGLSRARVMSTGTGAVQRTGAAVSAQRTSVQGSGTPVRSGAAAARTAVLVAGAGAVARAGSGVARQAARALGVGSPTRVGSGATDLVAVATGQGSPSRSGRATTAVQVQVSGQGLAGRVGAAVTRLLVAVTGTGQRGDSDLPPDTGRDVDVQVGAPFGVWAVGAPVRGLETVGVGTVSSGWSVGRPQV